MPGYNLTREEAEVRAGLITIQDYDITLDLTTSAETFVSTTVIRFSCSTPGEATFLDLIARGVRRVELNGLALDPATVFADSRIQLPNLTAENTVVVEALADYSHTGEGLHRFTDPVDDKTYLYSQCEVADARRIFAVFEQPDLKAIFTFHVIAPSDWTIISNQPTPLPVTLPPVDGVPVARWDFAPSPIMSSYLVAVIAGPYERWVDCYRSTDGREIPLAVFVRQSMACYMDAEEIFDITKRGFEFFETAFGIPYPYEKYDQAFVPEYNAGAMENIGAVTLTEARYIFRSKPVEAVVDARANTILHEQAHMWFGNLVTMKWWNDLWLNESFAEYMAHLAAVENTRWTGAWVDFLASRKLVAYQQDQLPTTHPIVAEIRDLADVEVNFDMITYAKGASVLKQLVAWVGQDNFLDAVHNYLTKYAEGNATLADFLAEVEKSSRRDLGRWSKLWLEEAGVTILRPETVVADGVYERVTILQEVPEVYDRFATVPHRDLPEIVVTPSLRPHHIKLAGYRLAAGELVGDWVEEVDIDGERTDLVALAGKPVPDLLIINDDDLTYAKLRLDEAGRAALPGVLGALRDPLTRALVAGSLWDSLRDGEISAQFYIEMILKVIATETASMTLLSLLTRLMTALRSYVTPAQRPAVMAATASYLKELVGQAEPGSDQQLQCFQAFATLTRDPAQLDYLGAILDGEAEIPGLIIDTDRRWELLINLVATGRRGGSAIEAELERDNTMSGRESAAGARAALPSLNSKWQAWQVAVEDLSISNATQRSVLAGFVKVTDPSLLRPFASQYFSQIEQTWATRSREMAQNIVEGLYPYRLLDDPEIDILALTDQWLDQLGARLPALRRLILVAREEVIRARLAQAVDR
ncbi:MAG: aminopeptidase N [Propionibacteriaceae bacterium]|jgi:aminopeptidase N|nr:aminopeptidase N [Propionibacteriaceae bacterium]